MLNSTIINEWNDFLKKVQTCNDCNVEYNMVNILCNIRYNDPWGLAWYDKYRDNFNGGLMIVGMDFGNEEMVLRFRHKYNQNKQYEPAWKDDRSYNRLSNFLSSASLEKNAFVTNAALCVRPGNKKITGAKQVAVYKNCLKHLRNQINIVKPYIIAPLGGTALKSVFNALGCNKSEFKANKKKIKEIAGKPIKITVNKAEVIIFPMIHPAMAQKGWTDKIQKRKLYSKIKELLDKKEKSTNRVNFKNLFGKLDCNTH